MCDRRSRAGTRALGCRLRWFRFLLLRGTAKSGALKANALPGGARRLAVRAVKSAQFAFIGAKRETLDRRSGRSRRRFSAGRGTKRRLLVENPDCKHWIGN